MPRDRWSIAAAIVVPFVIMTVYLVWIFPWPPGGSLRAELAPYVLSLLSGVPFAWGLTRRSGRWWLLIVALFAGFAALWIYALAVLCGVRGYCL
jgi:hypothetical protein